MADARDDDDRPWDELTADEKSWVEQTGECPSTMPTADQIELARTEAEIKAATAALGSATVSAGKGREDGTDGDVPPVPLSDPRSTVTRERRIILTEQDAEKVAQTVFPAILNAISTMVGALPGHEQKIDLCVPPEIVRDVCVAAEQLFWEASGPSLGKLRIDIRDDDGATVDVEKEGKKETKHLKRVIYWITKHDS